MLCYALVSLLLGSSPCAAQDQKVVKISVDNAAIRTGPSREYNRVTVLPKGIKLGVVAREGDWYRVALGDRQQAYVSSSVVELLPAGTMYSQARLGNISARAHEKGTRITFSLTAPVAYRITQRLRPAALVVELYNCRMANYGVRQLEGTESILAIEPVQATTNTTEITFHLPQRQQTGYVPQYDANGSLLIDVRAPFDTTSLQGKLIGVDPGHGGIWSGAGGPTGLIEKDANLDIAIRLKQMLEMSGAGVYMTRETDVGFGSKGDPQSADLDPRRKLTKRAQVDFFVSVHNNHTGSGNPRAARGTETFYWTPMSITPAKIIHENLCAALGTEFRYVSWRPFYVLRDTDCPRVLVECCYLSHPDEEAALKTAQFRHMAAVGIFSGIREFFERSALTDGLEEPRIDLQPQPYG